MNCVWCSCKPDCVLMGYCIHITSDSIVRSSDKSYWNNSQDKAKGLCTYTFWDTRLSGFFIFFFFYAPANYTAALWIGSEFFRHEMKIFQMDWLWIDCFRPKCPLGQSKWQGRPCHRNVRHTWNIFGVENRSNVHECLKSILTAWG